MEPKFTNQDRIDSYLQNTMSDVERSAFLAEAEVNPLLQKELKFTSATKEALRQNQLKSNFKNWDRELDQKIGLKFAYRKVIAIAAGIALLVFSGLIINNNFKQENFEAYLTTIDTIYPMTNTSRGKSAESGNNIDELYIGQKYSEVIALLAASTDENAKFYLGNAQYKIGEYNLAEQSFKMYLAQEEASLINQANWYLALSYLKQEKLDQAKSILAQLKKGNTSYTQRAENLYSKITNR